VIKLTQEKYVKYSRQLVLPEIQWEGQQKIFDAKVLLVGLGGLGSPQALYLAAAGVGTLGLVDGDRVDLTNLQRQVIHSTKDLGTLKVDSAEKKIKDLNPDVAVRKHPFRLNSQNALDIISGYDIIVDCTDNFPARYLLSDACVMLKKPLVHGAIYRFGGQTTVLYPAQDGPCYRCLFPVPPPPGAVPTCAEAGVLGVVPGVVGLIQASEVMKLILGKGELLIGRLLICDLMGMNFQEVNLRRDQACPACGEHPSILELVDYEVFCGLQGPVSEEGAEPPRNITVIELARKLQAGKPLAFLDVREEWEMAIYSCFPQGIKIPYSRLASKWDTLLPHKGEEMVVCCLFGSKSLDACRFLKGKGFENVCNLQGGIEEWYLYEEQSRIEG
jgi:adenylyltransferase/sulfurtransferase